MTRVESVRIDTLCGTYRVNRAVKRPKFRGAAFFCLYYPCTDESIGLCSASAPSRLTAIILIIRGMRYAYKTWFVV